MSLVTSRKKGNITSASSDETADSQKSMQFYFGDKGVNPGSAIDETAEKDFSNTTDVEEDEPCLLSSSHEKSKELTFPPAVTRIINYLSSLTFAHVTLFIVVLLLFVLITEAPSHVRKTRNATLKKKYVEATALLNQKYAYLQKTINGENDRLVEPEHFCDECITEKGLLCKRRRDFLTKRCRSPLVEAVNLVVKTSPSCFKKDSNKEILSEIAKEADAENVVVEWDADGHVNPDFFCNECKGKTISITCGKFRTISSTCRGRVDFLNSHYGIPMQEGMDLVVNSDPVCFKKN